MTEIIPKMTVPTPESRTRSRSSDPAFLGHSGRPDNYHSCPGDQIQRGFGGFVPATPALRIDAAASDRA